jgi:hypothetical protein
MCKKPKDAKNGRHRLASDGHEKAINTEKRI